MERMKTFFRYLLIFIAFYLFTDLIVALSLTTGYRTMQPYGTTQESQISSLSSENYIVTMNDAKANGVSGYILGTIAKKSNDIKSAKYLKADFFSKRGNLLGTKLVDISQVGTDPQNYKINFEYSDAAYYKLSTLGIDDNNNLIDAARKYSGFIKR